MDKNEISKIRALCDGAYQEPWAVEKNGRYEDHDEATVKSYDAVIAEIDHYETAAFIAESRTIIPALLDEIERLQAQRDKAVEDTEFVKRWIHDIEVNAKGIERDITERDKIYIGVSGIMGAAMRIKKSLGLEDKDNG